MDYPVQLHYCPDELPRSAERTGRQLTGLCQQTTGENCPETSLWLVVELDGSASERFVQIALQQVFGWSVVTIIASRCSPELALSRLPGLRF